MLPKELQRDVTITEKFHHAFFDLYKRSDGIIVRVSGDDAHYTTAETIDYVNALHKMTNGTPHLLLLIPGKHSSMDSASRSYVATDEALKDIKAIAGVYTQVGHRLMGSLYVTYNKPKVPVQFFTTANEAIAWLKSQNA